MGGIALSQLNKGKLEEHWLKRILHAFDDLEYGSVQIIVHGGKIVQIERTKKERFPLEKEPHQR